MVVLRQSNLPWQEYGQKHCFANFETGFNAFAFFLHFGDYFASIRRIVAKILEKRCFAGFETEFTAFGLPFSALKWLFCVNRTYCCQNTSENLTFPHLKPVFQHAPFFFEQFGGYFASIGHTTATIRAKRLFCRL